MRIKALMKSNFSTYRNAIVLFSLIYMGVYLLGSILTVLTPGTTHFGLGTTVTTTYYTDGVLELYESQTWSNTILPIVIFMIVSALICSQSYTKFLITRSVSRKEIFIANSLFLIPLGAIMILVQMITIYTDSVIQQLDGSKWRGLETDIQIYQAPDMDNFFIFFLVTFSMLMAFAAMSYLTGTLLARWKVPTIAVSGALFILILTLLIRTGLYATIGDIISFMYTSDTTGLFIVLRQLTFAIIILLVTFPIMRRVTAAKQ